MGVQGLTSHLTHNRSFQRQVFPGNWLHWHWQPKRKEITTYTPKHKRETEKTALANKTISTLIWHVFSTSIQETEWAVLLKPHSQHEASDGTISQKLLAWQYLRTIQQMQATAKPVHIALYSSWSQHANCIYGLVNKQLQCGCCW